MSIAEARAGQALLFSEPSYSETGVWCVLNEEMDPAEWAGLCRKLGGMTAGEFEKVKAMLVSYLEGRKVDEKVNEGRVPLVSFGPSGIGGEYQREIPATRQNRRRWTVGGLVRVLFSM